jgi:hydrogenase-4 component B
MGCFPSVFMQRIAEFGQSFLHGEAPAHAVHWFSLTNLKGAAISIAIGAAVYFGFIRTLLMKKDHGGLSHYANFWSSHLDMENAIYRPLCALLAKVSVAFGRAVDITGDVILPKASVFLALLFSHTASSLPDWIVSGLRKTVLRKIPIPAENPEDHAPADLAVDINIPKEMDDVLNDFSYGLILFGIGLVVVIVYLVFHSR